MLRGFFVIWISLVAFVWYNYGLFSLLSTLFVLHVLILRVLPKVLFDWDFMDSANIASISAHEGYVQNSPYYGGRLTIEGLNEEDFRKWLETVVAKRTDCNRTIARFGPETFALYYFAPGLPVDQIGKVVPEVITQKDYDTFVQNKISSLKQKLGIPTWLVFFFPNYEGDACIFIMFHHTMYDGAGGRQLCAELMDNRGGCRKRNRLAELKNDLFFAYKAIANIPNLPKLVKTVNDTKWNKDSLKTAKMKRIVISGLDKNEALARCRKHKFTLNDLMVASQVAAYHEIHAKRGIQIDSVTFGFNVNMRFYPLPHRFGNEISVFMRTFPCKPANMDLLNNVRDAIMTFKKDNREAFLLPLLASQINILSHEANVKLMRRNGTRCIVSSNVPGPEDGEWTLLGKPVTNIYTEGISKSDIIHVSTCGKNLNLTWSYTTGKINQDAYAEYPYEVEKAFNELMKVLE